MKSFTPKFYSKKNQGFTLVEVMISMVISLILLLGVSQIFSSNKHAQRVSDGLGRLQENARFAMKIITADMRKAGYMGCAGTSNIKNHINTTLTTYDDDLLDFSKPTSGWEYSAGAAPSQTEPGEDFDNDNVSPTGTSANWRNNNNEILLDPLVGVAFHGSDVLIMKWTGDPIALAKLNANVVPANREIFTAVNHGVGNGAFLMLSDCSGGDIFQHVSNGNDDELVRDPISAGVVAPGNIFTVPVADEWGHAYKVTSTVSHIISRAYYIGMGVSGEPSLFRMTFGNTITGPAVEELAEGVENMQVLYGEDTDADMLPEKYVTAEQVGDHANVVSLKIGLIVRSPDDVKTAPASKSVNSLGTTINSLTDRKLRFLFTSTVKLRNKGAK